MIWWCIPVAWVLLLPIALALGGARLERRRRAKIQHEATWRMLERSMRL